MAGKAVTPAADRDLDAVAASEPDDGGHVSGVGGSDDRQRLGGVGQVPHLALVVERGIAGVDDPSAECAAKGGEVDGLGGEAQGDGGVHGVGGS
jgi:hypothetical protein